MNKICPLRITKDSALTKHLLLKKKLLEENNPAHEKIKTALIIDGGVLLATYGAGCAVGLAKMGLSDVFDYVIGESTGSTVAAYFVGKQAEFGATICYEDLASNKELFRFWRLRKIIDIDFYENCIRERKPLNQDVIRKSRSTLFIAVTNAKTGKGELLNAKDVTMDIITAIKASSLLPVFCGKPITIDGKDYVDGGIGFPYAIHYMVNKLGCTDVLIITNRNCACQEQYPSWFGWLYANFLLRGYSADFRRELLINNKVFRHDMDLLWGKEKIQQVNFGLLAEDKLSIGGFTQDKEKLLSVIQNAEKQVEQIFS